MIGTYEVRHLPSGRAYIGASVDVNRRLLAHRGMLRRGAHFNAGLQAAWEADGEEAFAFNPLAEHAVLGLRDCEAATIESRNGLVFNTSPVVQPGCRAANAGLTDAEVLSLRAKAAAGAATTDLAREYSIPRGTAGRIIRGDTYLYLTHGIPARGRMGARGERCHLSRLTADDVRAIRSQHDTSAPELAARYGVTVATIYQIRSRHTWKHI